MANWQSGMINVNGIHLHITRTGGKKTPLVLAHGVTDDGLCWSPVAEELSANYDVIMADARGHGQSNASIGRFDLGSLADDLQGIIQVLGLNKPLVMGHSLGALTSLVLAGLYPDVPRAIVLEDPPGFWIRLPASESQTKQSDYRAEATRLKGMTREQLMDEGRALNPLWSDAEFNPWADSKMKFDLNSILNIFSPHFTAAVVWDKIFTQISCPVLVLTADTDKGGILTPAGLETLRQFIPQLQTVYIPNSGHNIRRDQFIEYMKAVRTFLGTIPELDIPAK
jgi:N-formylmaleamate deformylase